MQIIPTCSGLYDPPISHFCGSPYAIVGAEVTLAEAPNQPYANPEGARFR
jgi:hypothetical protein